MVLGGKPFWLSSAVFNFFFLLSIFESSFLLANFKLTFFGQWFNLKRWQASMLTGSISALHSRNISQTLLWRSFWEMLSRMPKISRHSLLEFCSFAQHFPSTLVSWLVQIFFSCYNRCFRFFPPFLAASPGFTGYVIIARDLQLLNFALWLLNIRPFSERATE